MKKLTIPLFILSLIVPLVVNAATYYVAKTGNNSNSCAQAQNQATPRLTIQAGISCMVGGDTLQIKAGTYAETITNPPGSNSFTNATTLTRFGTDAVTVQGGSFSGSSVGYIIINGIKFDSTGLGRNEVIWLDQGAHHVRFINIEVTGSAGAAGIALYEGSGGFNEVLNSRIHHNGSSSQLDHGIYIKSRGNLIRGNEFDHNAASGVQFYNNGTDMGTGNVVTQNLIHDNRLGMFLWETTGPIVSNNVIYNHPDVGISVYRAPNALIFNNTITGNGASAIDLSNSSSVAIRNNIIYNNGAGINDSGSAIKSNNLTTNPLFVSATNFALLSGSPAIDTGVNLSPTVTVDFAGVGRPVGGAYDIGAYEFSTSTGLPAPSSLVVSP